MDNVRRINPYASETTKEHLNNLSKLYDLVVRPSMKPVGNLSNYGLDVTVSSDFPIACGLNSSGATAACLARALIDNYLDIDSFCSSVGLESRDPNEVVFFLGWMIDNCFHAFRSSGAGLAAAIHGRRGRHPLIYFTQKRSYLRHRQRSGGWRKIEYALKKSDLRKLVGLKYFRFDPTGDRDDFLDYPRPPNFQIALLYSGGIKKTEQAIKTHEQSVRSYRASSERRVKEAYDRIVAAIGEKNLHRSVAVHIRDFIGKIYLNTALDEASKNAQLSKGNLEIVAEAMGDISVAVVNSILDDWRMVPKLMSAYQALLTVADLSTEPIDALVAQGKARSLELGIEFGTGLKTTAQVKAGTSSF